VPFVPGRRPTDEDARPGLGSSDNAALVTGGDSDNRAVLLFEASDLPADAVVDVTVAFDGELLPDWDRRSVELTQHARQRLELRPNRDLTGVELGFVAGFMRKARVELRVTRDGSTLASDEAWLDVCDVRNFGSLYKRIIHRLVAPDTARQATKARLPDPGVAYHPWYPVLTIGATRSASTRRRSWPTSSARSII
jgi:hypothetical protein